jgi:tRNA(Leu) C34 or U34 (ribose-2'-O)-methylase TrmL
VLSSEMEIEAVSSAATADAHPAMCLVISSVSKRANIGTCIRSAVALGCKSLVITGSCKVRTEGAQRTEKYIELRRFPKLPPAVEWLRSQGYTICGIEINASSLPVHLHPFRGPTAFIAGNEGTGLPPEHQALCDHFVYIPQFSQGTASLNVAVATSIVLSHFATWAGFSEAKRDPSNPEKFLVEEPPAKRGITSSLDAELHRFRRDAATEAATAETLDGDALGGLFGAADSVDATDVSEHED